VLDTVFEAVCPRFSDASEERAHQRPRFQTTRENRVDDGFAAHRLGSQIENYYIRPALLHNPELGCSAPDPRRSYATRTVSGVPSWVNRLRIETRTCSSVTCRSKSLAITRSPSLLKQPILVSTRLRR